MDLSQIIFLILAVVILGSGLMVVTSRNMVHAALWLIVTLFGVAVVYAYLSVGFRRCTGRDLHRGDRHPLHLCGHVDPQRHAGSRSSA